MHRCPILTSREKRSAISWAISSLLGRRSSRHSGPRVMSSPARPQLRSVSTCWTDWADCLRESFRLIVAPGGCFQSVIGPSFSIRWRWFVCHLPTLYISPVGRSRQPCRRLHVYWCGPSSLFTECALCKKCGDPMDDGATFSIVIPVLPHAFVSAQVLNFLRDCDATPVSRTTAYCRHASNTRTWRATSNGTGGAA